jgi:hypothetical protein
MRLDMTAVTQRRGLRSKRAQEAPMGRSNVSRLALAAAFAACVGACQTEQRNIPNMTLAEALALPPDKVPKIFRDPTNPYGYPYNVHETDGLSRNPDDCNKWGCVDVGGGGF